MSSPVPFYVLSSATRMANSTRYEEQIGVRLPDGTRQTVTVHVVVDEEVLRHISTVVGTVFSVKGKKFEVVSKYPFRIKKLLGVVEEPAEVVVETTPPPAEEPEAEVRVDEPPPQSERRPSTMPAVGERWRPKDPRRIADFTVTAIEGDHALTDDGRRIQLSRFKRYQRIDAPKTKVS